MSLYEERGTVDISKKAKIKQREERRRTKVRKLVRRIRKIEHELPEIEKAQFPMTAEIYAAAYWHRVAKEMPPKDIRLAAQEIQRYETLDHPMPGLFYSMYDAIQTRLVEDTLGLNEVKDA